MNKFNQNQADHELILTKLKYSFALKMATLICWSVVATIIILGMFFGSKSLIALEFIVVVAIIMGIITFISSFRAGMAI